MGLMDRLRAAGRTLREGIDPVGASIDQDDDLYRRITGNRRDLNPVAQERAREISIYLWRRNPMARRLIEMIVDFVVGEGVTFEAADDTVQERLMAFWKDPAMNLELRHRDFVRDLSLTGELAFKCYVGGRSRLGFIDADRIKDVRKDPDNALVDEYLVLKPQTAGDPDETIKLVTLDETDPTVYRRTGDALFYGINRLTAGSRGTPDLLAIADWIDGYDQTLWNLIDRAALQNAFIFDVTLDGQEDADVQEWMAKHGTPPKPGTVRVHNDKEHWQAVAPNLGATEAHEATRLIKNYVLGGAGLPEGWFADGDAANRATLAEQGDPTYKMLTSRQRFVRFIFEDILAWRIEADIAQGLLPESVDRSVTVNMPEMSEDDAKGVATALPQLVNALTAAIDSELIDTKSSRRLFLALAGQLGVDLDETEVEDAVEEEAAIADEEAKAMAAMGLAPTTPAVAAGNGPTRPASPAAAPRPRPTIVKP